MHKDQRGHRPHPRSLILTDLCWQAILQEWRICRAAQRDLTGALFGTATPRRLRARYFLLANQTAASDEGLARIRLLHFRPLGRVQSMGPDTNPAALLRALPFTTAPGDVLLLITRNVTPTIAKSYLIQADEPLLTPIPVHIERPRRASSAGELP